MSDDMLPKVMILDGNMLGAWGELGVVRHGYARLIVLVHSNDKFWMWNVKLEDDIHLLHQIHQRYSLPQSL